METIEKDSACRGESKQSILKFDYNCREFYFKIGNYVYNW